MPSATANTQTHIRRGAALHRVCLQTILFLSNVRPVLDSSTAITDLNSKVIFRIIPLCPYLFLSTPVILFSCGFVQRGFCLSEEGLYEKWLAENQFQLESEKNQNR